MNPGGRFAPQLNFLKVSEARSPTRAPTRGGPASLQITALKIPQKKGDGQTDERTRFRRSPPNWDPFQIDRSGKMDSIVVNLGILDFLVLGQWRPFSGPSKIA